MKPGIITILLLSFSFFGNAQKVIENPKYSISSPGYIELKKIELTTDATILTFYLKIPQNNWIRVHDKSFIQPVGDTTKLYLIKAEGINMDEHTYWEKDKMEEITYRLFFPKLNDDVAKIDFGEPINNSFKFYDIEVKESPYSSVIQKEFLGNWFSEENGNWTFSFCENVAISDSKTWEYVSVAPENDIFKIKLKSGKEEKLLYGKLEKEGACLLGNSPDSMKKFTSKRIQNNNLNPEEMDESVFKSGTVVYKGFFKGFSKRLGVNTGMIRFVNRLTNSQESYLIKLDDNGSFEVEFPLDFPQELTVSLPLINERVFFEPGKNLFHLVNTGDPEYPSLFMGESAGLNAGLSASSKIKTEQNKLLEGINEMSETEYLNHIKTVWENERKALNEIQKEKSIGKQAMQIRNLDINFRVALNALQYNQNRRFDWYMSNREVKENERLPFEPAKTDPSNLIFLKDIPLNNKTSVLSGEYFNLLSVIRYIDFSRPQGSYFYILGLLQNELQNNGTKLSGEESDMFDFVNENLVENYSEEAGKNFTKSYGELMRSFVQKYQEVYSQINNQVMFENFKTNLKNVFGIERGLAMDIINTQAYLVSLKSKTLNEEEFTKVKSSVQTDYLKELIISSYYERKAELAIKNTPSEYVPKTEAEKFFDSLIKKYRGKVVYVDFWATWCAPCKDGIARIKPLKEELVKEDIVFVYITNPTSPENDYKKAIPDIKGEHFKVSADEWNLLTSKFNIYGIPHYALVDKSGRVINPHLNHLENEPLKKLLLGEVNK